MQSLQLEEDARLMKLGADLDRKFRRPAPSIEVEIAATIRAP
jgi:hypothetical protein